MSPTDGEDHNYFTKHRPWWLGVMDGAEQTAELKYFRQKAWDGSPG